MIFRGVRRLFVGHQAHFDCCAAIGPNHGKRRNGDERGAFFGGTDASLLQLEAKGFSVVKQTFDAPSLSIVIKRLLPTGAVGDEYQPLAGFEPLCSTVEKNLRASERVIDMGLPSGRPRTGLLAPQQDLSLTVVYCVRSATTDHGLGVMLFALAKAINSSCCSTNPD